MKGRILLISFVLMVLGLVSGCDLTGSGGKFVAADTTQVDVKAIKDIRIDIVNGDIKIKAVPDVKGIDFVLIKEAHGRTQSSARKNLDRFKITMDIEDSSLTISDDTPRELKNGRKFKIYITMPSTLSSAKLSMVNGEISLEGKLDSATIKGVNGELSFKGHASNLSVGLVNGTIHTSGGFNRFACSVVNGNIDGNIDEIRDGSASCVNGSIHFTISGLKNLKVVASALKPEYIDITGFDSVHESDSKIVAVLGDGVNLLQLSTVTGQIKVEAVKNVYALRN